MFRYKKRACGEGKDHNMQVGRLKERLEEVEGAVAQLRAGGADPPAGGAPPCAGDAPPSAAAETVALQERLAAVEIAAVAQWDSAQQEVVQLRGKVIAGVFLLTLML